MSRLRDFSLAKLLQVAELFSCGSSNPAKAVLRGKTSLSENLVIYPPNGIIPFHGLAMFCAPFCYVYTEPLQFYFTFRAMYLRYNRLAFKSVLFFCLVITKLFLNFLFNIPDRHKILSKNKSFL